jgi:hypothetical protein
MCYNSQAVERDGITKRLRAQKLPIEEQKRAKPKKLFQKNIKKVLTNGKVCDIITKLAARAESETVLEN